MMRKQFWLSAMIVIFVTSLSCFGQTAAGSRIQAAGYSFTAPSGWKIREEKGYALVEPAGRSIVMVTSHQYNDFASALRDTTLEQGETAGEPQNIKGGKTIRVTKRTAEGVTVVDLFVLFSPNGGGVIVIALGESKNADVSFFSGLNIANSVTFTQGATPQRQSAAGSGWQAHLAGKHLLYLYSGNGYFEEKHIYLCGSGTFYQTTGSGGFTPGDSDGGSFAARGGKRGRWSVDGSALVLQFQDGTVGEYNLTRRTANNEIGMNGRRYFVQANANCN